MGGVNNTFIYDTNTLIGLVPNLKRAQKFLLNNFFPNVTVSDTEFVSIDVDIGKRRMSPFCSPMVEGKMVESRRYQTNIFKPAYIKDKRVPDLRKPIRRQIGEKIGGVLSPAERAAANLQFEMEDQIDMLDRRLEWMAASVLRTGSLVVSGDGFPTTTIDFGRDSTLTVVLAGAGKWGVTANFDAAGRDPIPAKSIEDWQQRILKLSGAVATDLVFTTTPWSMFINGVGIYNAVYFPKLGDNGNSMNPGAQIQRGAVFKGMWGQYRLWVYNDWYVDDNNVEQPMIPDGTVLMTGPDMLGQQAFATILDPELNYPQMMYAPKTWVLHDPPQRILMMQSAPLVIPSRVNAALAATVI